jgi:hypothetical protein
MKFEGAGREGMGSDIYVGGIKQKKALVRLMIGFPGNKCE